MADAWRGWGSERRNRFEDELSPGNLRETLKEYRLELGKDFSLQDLIRIEEIRSRTMIAEAISDFPEFLSDQIGIMQTDSNVPTLAKELGRIADCAERKTDE